MSENDFTERSDSEGVYSKVLRAGRRTYFFDVRETRAGDYYLTITESKKNTGEDGSFFYKKHKIYLYKEDFQSVIREILTIIILRKIIKMKRWQKETGPSPLPTLILTTFEFKPDN